MLPPPSAANICDACAGSSAPDIYGRFK
uniref:Uncharacterized protein n=1 Tax=Arundo donax TaxID=35708 RepID=A0A0A9GKR1_ARUDO